MEVSSSLAAPLMVIVLSLLLGSVHTNFRALLHDVNRDGRMDVVSARTNAPFFGSPDSQLVWFEQPASAPFSGPWRMRSLAKGPDFFFRIHDFDRDGQPEIIATQFFTSQLSVYTFPDGWMRPETVIKTEIDTSLGAMFDASLVDIDGSA